MGTVAQEKGENTEKEVLKTPGDLLRHLRMKGFQVSGPKKRGRGKKQAENDLDIEKEMQSFLESANTSENPPPLFDQDGNMVQKESDENGVSGKKRKGKPQNEVAAKPKRGRKPKNQVAAN